MWKMPPFAIRACCKNGSTSILALSQFVNRPHLAGWVVLVTLTFCAAGCGPKAMDKGPAKHYHLTGKIVSVNSKDQTASIEAAAIPDYMDAMTMSYPIAKKSELDTLHPGDEIRATVNVYDSGDFDLSSIEKKTK